MTTKKKSLAKKVSTITHRDGIPVGYPGARWGVVVDAFERAEKCRAQAHARCNKAVIKWVDDVFIPCAVSAILDTGKNFYVKGVTLEDANVAGYTGEDFIAALAPLNEKLNITVRKQFDRNGVFYVTVSKKEEKQ